MLLRIGRLTVLSLVLLVFAFMSWVHAGPSIPFEYQVKAAFLYNFTEYVEWPHDLLPDGSKAIKVGVLGDSPILAALEALEIDESGGYSLDLKQFDSVDDLVYCHVLFVGCPEQPCLSAALGKAQAMGILTVGETEEFGTNGGVIRFILAEKKVRFTINNRAAQKAGLKVSSKLLRLAQISEERK
jgi:hypothetical protein